MATQERLEEARQSLLEFRETTPAGISAPTNRIEEAKLELQNFRKQQKSQGLIQDLQTNLEERFAKGEFEEKPEGILERLRKSFVTRAGRIIKTTGEVKRGEVSPQRGAFRVVGREVAGQAVDIAEAGFEGALKGAVGIGKILLPKEAEIVIERQLKQFVEDVKTADPTKKAGFKEGLKANLELLGVGVNEFEKFEEKNPELAQDVRAVANIADLITLGVGGRVVKESGVITGEKLSRTAGATAKALEESVEKKQRSFVRSLIKPEQTKKAKEAQVTRTTEKGVSVFKKSVIEPTSSQLKSEEAVIKLAPKVNNKKTAQRNFNIIQEANVKAAKKLEVDLKANNFIYNESQLLSKLNKAKENLKNNPAIVGDAEKTAEKLIAEVERRVKDSKKTGADLLQVRKEFDIWVKSQKGANVFDPAKENAFSIANREIRQTINDFIATKAKNVEVKKSLSDQRALFNALEDISPKAAIEADTAVRRFFQRTSKMLGTKNKAVQFLAAAVGIGGLGAAAFFAPAVAVIGGTGLLVRQAGKIVLSPTAKNVLIKILRELEKVSTQEAKLLKKDIEKFLDGDIPPPKK